MAVYVGVENEFYLRRRDSVCTCTSPRDVIKGGASQRPKRGMYMHDHVKIYPDGEFIETVTPPVNGGPNEVERLTSFITQARNHLLELAPEYVFYGHSMHWNVSVANYDISAKKFDYLSRFVKTYGFHQPGKTFWFDLSLVADGTRLEIRTDSLREAPHMNNIGTLLFAFAHAIESSTYFPTISNQDLCVLPFLEYSEQVLDILGPYIENKAARDISYWSADVSPVDDFEHTDPESCRLSQELFRGEVSTTESISLWERVFAGSRIGLEFGYYHIGDCDLENLGEVYEYFRNTAKLEKESLVVR